MVVGRNFLRVFCDQIFRFANFFGSVFVSDINFQRSGFGLSEKHFAFEKLRESGAMKSLNVVTLLITVNQGRKKEVHMR